MHAVDIYGLSEVMGPGVANECVETKDGLHIWEDHFYPEIIDPGDRRGAARRRARRARVHLADQGGACRSIRYRTRDLTRLLPGTARTMRRMEKITGRSDDMMIVRGVNVFPTQIEEQILKVEGPGAALPDRADARGPARRDGGAGGGGARSGGGRCARAASAAELGHHVKGVIGVTATITVADPGGVERSQGKARRVIDKRPKG